jgi:hypothetical protein
MRDLEAAKAVSFLSRKNYPTIMHYYVDNHESRNKDQRATKEK